MKRLFTHLLILTVALLAIPNRALADNMFLHFWGGYLNNNGSGSDKEMGGTGSDTWAYSFNTEDCTDQTVYLLPKANNSIYMKAYDEDTSSDLTNGSSVTCYDESNANNKYNVSIKLPDDWATKNYKVTISATNYDSTYHGITLTITWVEVGYSEQSITLRTDAYQRANNAEWIPIRYNEFDSENNIYIWYLNTISNFTSSSKFRLEFKDTRYGNNETVGDSWKTIEVGSESTNCTPTLPTTTGNQVARLEAKKVGSSWQARIVAGDGAHQYYWVSPQITNGEMWPAFRMVPSRNRYWSGSYVLGDGLASTKYYTFTIKDDDLVTWRTKSQIASGTEIQWYILRDDGVVVYRPTTDLSAGYIPNGGTDYPNEHPVKGSLDSYVDFINFWNGSSYDGATAYKTTDTSRSGSWAFSKGSAKAHTFNLNADRGHVLYNYTVNGTDDNNGYKLAGNWTAGKEVTISLEDAKPMTKYWYKGGTAYTSEVAVADSIVYKVDVEKPSGGWGGLYLDILPGSSSTDWIYATVLRPLITLGNNLDGRALHGALTTSSSDQSLNPETSDSYLGYTFSFNATTMTYRLEFHMPDATLSPGDDGNNIVFDDTWGETIAVNYSEATTLASAATKCYITAGASADITLDETTPRQKDEFGSFRLTYDGSAVYMDGTKVADGNTAYIKIRGEADNGDKGEIHTYQYTFTATMSFEPQGGLFINSAKIKIEGGTAPYSYEVWTYGTKTENGETVIDTSNGTKITDGTFANTTFDANDKNYRISTPGFLKIIDANGVAQSYDVIDGGFDFTYSTSENYKTALTSTEAKPNGDDYYRVMLGDYTWKVGKTWEHADTPQNEESWQVTSEKHWSGNEATSYLHIRKNEAYQTVTDLPAGTYTVQAIVRGGGVPVYLKLNDTQVASINLTSDGTDAKTTINKYGRSEQLVEMSADKNKRGWHKLEGSITLATDGNLKIAVRTDYDGTGGSIDLADVYLLKDVNTDGNYWTTAPTSETDTWCDMSNRTKYNAFSFFDRGKNLNSIIKASQKTVIGMSEDNEPYGETGRRHPCNVVTSSDGTTWSTPMLALTDYAAKIIGSEAKYGSEPKVSQHAYGTSFDYTADKFSYDRATSAKMMSTVLPFPMTRTQVESMLGSGVKTYTTPIIDKTKLRISFTETTGDISEHTPFFFLPAEEKTAMTLNEPISVKATTATTLAEGLVGTYKHTHNVGTYYKGENFIPYFFQDDKFVYAQDNANAKPFRVVFLLDKNSGSSARVLSASFFDDTVTAIDGISETTMQKAPVYSVDGKLVSNDGNTNGLRKGIYIQAGKKFIIK